MGTLKGLLRSHHCGELRNEDVGSEVTLCGWINKNRDLGGLHFVDLRDKYGITQLNFSGYKGDLDELKKLSLESVIKVKGKVASRPKEAQNNEMLTGQVEVQVGAFEILSSADKDHIPFLPNSMVESTEDLKLKYRYLDLRTKRLQDILALRARTTMRVREVLTEEGFIEVETPILYKTTPEGARDYIVPSRVQPGKAYALPQSPQTLKQLLMIGGTDKYFQICRCFRDEDLRADRQPEFSQIDIEVSFATQEYIRNLVTKMVKTVFGLSEHFELPLMSFHKAMELYGSDKPDIRFGLKQMNVTNLFHDSDFGTFASVSKSGGLVKAMFLPKSVGVLTRKDIDALPEIVKPYGGKGVATYKVEGSERSGGISKFITDSIHASLEERSFLLGESKGDGMWFLVADVNHDVTHACADAVRRHLGQKFNMMAEGYHFLWVYDFPLLEWDAKDYRFAARHHPFTSPKPNCLADFMSGEPEKLKNVLADAYDLVCNGYELGGGSIRIHNQDVQSQMFKVLGFTEEDTKRQFGFFIEALRYGVPPHGGLAFGLDRMIMLLAGTNNIRDVIAFPKTASASDLMSGAPSEPAPAQLEELHFTWSKKE